MFLAGGKSARPGWYDYIILSMVSKKLPTFALFEIFFSGISSCNNYDIFMVNLNICVLIYDVDFLLKNKAIFFDRV